MTDETKAFLVEYAKERISQNVGALLVLREMRELTSFAFGLVQLRAFAEMYVPELFNTHRNIKGIE